MPYSLQTLTETLANAGVAEPREEAVLLISAFADVSRVSLLCDRHRLFDLPALNHAVHLRLSRYPLQYILGTWDFFGLTFRVDEHCLIPRPDTEVLVEQAIRHIPQGASVADLCTGSGCIAVALLRARPDVTCVALELFPETLALATENTVRNGVADRFVPLQADLLGDGVEKLKAVNKGKPLDAILSNPPYIRKGALAHLAPELAFEPQAALDGGEDGLTFYRTILRDYRPLLTSGGRLLMEIGYDQAEDIRRMAAQIGGWRDLCVVRDLGDRDRVVILTAADTIPED